MAQLVTVPGCYPDELSSNSGTRMVRIIPTICPLDYTSMNTQIRKIFLKRKKLFESEQCFSCLSLSKLVLIVANKFFTGNTLARKELWFPKKQEQIYQVLLKTCWKSTAVLPKPISALYLLQSGLLADVLAFACILSLVFPRNVSSERGSSLHLPHCSDVPHFCVLLRHIHKAQGSFTSF